MTEKNRSRGNSVGTKAIAAKVLLEAGESIRSTASAVNLAPGTVHALSQQQILSDAELNSLERIIREKALRKAELAIDGITPEKLKKSRASELATIAGNLRKLAEGEKSSTAKMCETLILTKYAVRDIPPVVVDTP